MRVYSQVNMSLDSIFQNLTPDELQHASEWLKHLRQPEIPRVSETLQAINRAEFYFSSQPRQRRRFAVIVAGSSIDTTNYKDIDLFLLSQEELNPEKTRKNGINAIIMDHLEGNLPDLTYYTVYGPVNSDVALDKKELFARGLGAAVTISLFYGLTGFSDRRTSHTGDLLDPRVPMTAEQLIQYNREQGSKFLVLSRQYPINT